MGSLRGLSWLPGSAVVYLLTLIPFFAESTETSYLLLANGGVQVLGCRPPRP
jgi:hypothetical protein